MSHSVVETIMNTKADKAVKKITHHVPSRQMIYITNRVEPREKLKKITVKVVSNKNT
jgi:hypothetical protein